MNPKKVRDMLPVFAIENKEDLVLLQKLNSFYWNKVRETLSTTDHFNVNVINLGSFVRKSWSVDKMILKKTGLLKAVEHTTREAMKTNLQNELTLLGRIKLREQQENELKEKVKLKRKEYELNKDLEKPGTDIRGSQEFSI